MDVVYSLFDVVKLKNGMTGTLVEICSRDVFIIELDEPFIVDDVWLMHIYSTDIASILYHHPQAQTNGEYDTCNLA